VKNYEFIFNQFQTEFGGRSVDTFTPDEILSFITKLTDGTKQTTKHNRYSSLKAFFNFIINSIDPNIKNPCDTPILRKISKDRKSLPWPIIEKKLIDEIIFKTVIPRNRIMLELMARGGMRGGEVLKLTPPDVQDRKLVIRDPKSGKEQEVILKEYIWAKNFNSHDRIFQICYEAARKIVKRAGEMVGVTLRPHDLRRHSATYASRCGVPIEIVSKVILRHANLSTTRCTNCIPTKL
jgi:integrase